MILTRYTTIIVHLVILSIMLVHKPIGATEGDEIFITDFAKKTLDGWSPVNFKGETHYSFVDIDGRSALRAISNNSASGYAWKKTIDLKKYPYLNWRWRTETRLGSFDEKSRSGDDYSLRLYVIHRTPGVFGTRRWINYVWSANNTKGASWPNAFVSAAKMFVVRDQTDDLSRWYSEKRNIIDDFRNLQGIDVETIDLVALMTDTDNIQGNAISHYGDIHFSSN